MKKIENEKDKGVGGWRGKIHRAPSTTVSDLSLPRGQPLELQLFCFLFSMERGLCKLLYESRIY